MTEPNITAAGTAPAAATATATASDGSTAVAEVASPGQSIEDKVASATQLGAALTSLFVPAQVGAEVTALTGLEPVVFHLISAFVSLFKHHAATVAAQKK